MSKEASTHIQTVHANLVGWEDLNLSTNQIAIWWLGQAGFLFRFRNYRFIIDPYLSDSLAIKYHGKEHAHIRMMPIPIEPQQLRGINWIFSTHAHSDHMDIGTIPDLIRNNPQSKLFAPKASAEKVSQLVGSNSHNAILVNTDDHIQLAPAISVDVISSAHEDLQFNEQGNSVFLGFIFSIDGVKIYHSGDCVPYNGLPHILESHKINIAMLPVNGRDTHRLSTGVAGNFHFEEAVELCRKAQIKHLIPHHFEMFDFNTVNREVLQQKINSLKNGLTVTLPEKDKAFIVDLRR